MVTFPPFGISTSRIKPGVPSSTVEPSPTSTRKVASPSLRTGTSFGSTTFAKGSTFLSLRARFTQKRRPRMVVTLPSRRSSSPRPSVVDTTARPDKENRSFVQPGPLEGASAAGAVTCARRSRDRVPHVVESAVRGRGVLRGHLRIDLDLSLVDEDVRVHERVRDVA